MSELRGACSVALNVMLANLYTDCGNAVASLCPTTSSSTSGDESVYVLTCLSNHESELSADCQQQVNMAVVIKLTLVHCLYFPICLTSTSTSYLPFFATPPSLAVPLAGLLPQRAVSLHQGGGTVLFACLRDS
jgi:hypothetical protein